MTKASAIMTVFEYRDTARKFRRVANKTSSEVMKDHWNSLSDGYYRLARKYVHKAREAR